MLARPEQHDQKEAIRAHARAAGFDAVGFAAAAPGRDDAVNLRAYLAEGRHGQMDWMARTSDRRADPQALWPQARSVICVGVNYGPAEPALAGLSRVGSANISVYARSRDYHKVLGKRLKALGRWLSDTHACEVKVFVDTAPVMEKPLAQRAGLGWIGKHTNLVSRRFGSWLFLGEVFTTLELAPDEPAADHCGSCDRCLRACPTGALAEPYRIDPRRCISYLPIEHKGGIDPVLEAAMGNRVYGCDDCLAACPWNRFAVPAAEPDLQPRGDLAAPALADLGRLDDAAFREAFAGTTIRRTGRNRMLRNVAVAAGNTGDRATAALAAADADPLVSAAGRRALQRCGPGETP